jgi:hypothetical protein
MTAYLQEEGFHFSSQLVPASWAQGEGQLQQVKKAQLVPVLPFPPQSGERG